MAKKENQRQVSRPVIKISGPPSLGEIDQLFAEAVRQAGSKLTVAWMNRDKSKEFSLCVMLSSKSGEAEWECFEGEGRTAIPLWSYLTSDILLVFNLIASSMRSVEYKEAASGTRLKATEGYHEIYQIPDAYYRTALDLMADDQHKLSILSQGSAGKIEARSTLHGDLSLVDIVSVMRAAIGGKLTGRLRLRTPISDAEVFFDKGQPVHAVSGALKGDECLISLMLASEGEFKFEPDIMADKKTVRESADKVILKGALLRDKAMYLYNAGLRTNSVLLRKRKDLAEAEFEEISTSVASGSHLSFSMLAQKQFYLAVDDKSTVAEIVEKLRLTESQWIPILCRMVKADFVAILGNRPKNEQTADVERKLVDRQAIHAVRMSLRRQETGMYSYPALLYFLEQESLKHYRLNKSLSIAVIELRVAGSIFEYRSPLPAPLLNECVRRISSLMRDSDMLGHYEIFDMAVILPDTNQEGSEVFAKRVMEALTNPPILTPSDGELLIAIGTATIPEDAKEIGFLLGCAERARNEAQQAPNGVVRYSRVPSKVGTPT